MVMKSETIQTKQHIGFPVLMIGKQGMVVMFAEPDTGVVVNEVDDGLSLGTVAQFVISEFEQFHGKVILLQ